MFRLESQDAAISGGRFMQCYKKQYVVGWSSLSSVIAKFLAAGGKIAGPWLDE
jgi:hypothetical protein